jgi:uncharacterized membrane protein
MREIIVVGFHAKHRAAEVLARLQELQYEWTIDLADAVAAYRSDDGRLRVDQSVELTTRQGAGWGGLLGGLLGAVIAAPFTGGMSIPFAATTVGLGALSGGTLGAALGATDAGEWKQRYGVGDDFVRDVGGMIQPGDSAVFALVRRADPEVVAEKFRGYGGRILRTSLPLTAAAHLQSTLAD